MKNLAWLIVALCVAILSVIIVVAGVEIFAVLRWLSNLKELLP